MTRGKLLAVGGVVGLMAILVVALSTRDGARSTRDGARPPTLGSEAASTVAGAAPSTNGNPQLARLGKLVRARGESVTKAIDKDAAEIALDGGARIVVPAGAFDRPVKLTVSVVDLNLHHLATDVKNARAYVVTCDHDFERLFHPLVLEIPKSPNDVAAIEMSGPEWRVIHIPQGDAARVEIDHFSERVTAIHEWTFGVFDTVARAVGGNPDPTIVARAELEASPQATKSFFGVGEASKKKEHDICQEMREMLAAFKNEKNMAFPDEYSVDELTGYLLGGDSPSVVGGFYWHATKDSQPIIDARLAEASAKSGPQSLAAFLKICIEANGNNVPRGVLAAQNYLKNVAYEGRRAYGYYDNAREHGGRPEQLQKARDTMNRDIEQWGKRAAMLEPWRQDPIAPGGYYDKMGPIYHVFAAMTAGLWGGHVYGSGAVNAEALLRTSRAGVDRPDNVKGLADDCGLSIAVWLNDGQYGAVPAPAEPASDGFRKDDIGAIDKRFLLGRNGDRATGLGEGDVSQENTFITGTLEGASWDSDRLVWTVKAHRTADEARHMLHGNTATLKEQAARFVASNATLTGSKIADASRYSANEALRSQIQTVENGGMIEVTTRIECFAIYRDRFLIRYERWNNGGYYKDGARPGDKPAEDFMAECERFIGESKKLIDKRFPTQERKPV